MTGRRLFSLWFLGTVLLSLSSMAGCTLWVQNQNAEVEESSKTSCANSCGINREECFCDIRCLQSGDCCEDFVVECGGSEDADSCEGRCGRQAPVGCFCTDDCIAGVGDGCCPDAQDVCSLEVPEGAADGGT